MPETTLDAARIDNAIVFLCSEEASFITGHPLVVDGGLTARDLAREVQPGTDTSSPAIA